MLKDPILKEQKLKDLIKEIEPVHVREITMSTYAHPRAGLLVHGCLKDVRRLPIVDILGRPKEPGVIHHMTATLAIASDPLRIVRAEAEMLTVPTEFCSQTLDRIENLAGLEVKTGFSRQVKKIVGGPEGCIHMCSLVTAMGTEIVHGWLTEKRSRSAKGLIDLEGIKENMFLIDSCRIWKKDGPRVREVLKAMEAQKKAN